MRISVWACMLHCGKFAICCNDCVFNGKTLPILLQVLARAIGWIRTLCSLQPDEEQAPMAFECSRWETASRDTFNWFGWRVSNCYVFSDIVLSSANYGWASFFYFDLHTGCLLQLFNKHGFVRHMLKMPRISPFFGGKYRVS